MNQYVYVNGSIGITWFALLSVISGIVGYVYIKITNKNYDIEKTIIEDTYFLLIITGLLGARIGYVILNFDVYKGDFFNIISLDHITLNLYGAILFGVISVYVVAKRKKLRFRDLIKPYIIPFYVAMAIGVWTKYLDGFLIGNKYNGPLSHYYFGANRHLVPLYLSILFVLAIVLEIVQRKKVGKNLSIVIFVLSIIIHPIIKSVFT
ncbi:prolipoprotein diacylglyceryl transferase family protein [Dethiothermospora halolimnae]|uniref:prolipoprotein diacylglyceryl transferase family protein n=1 Tax=Dethiothermospora halolimnae TaxID=3114390 RepID=UPI003CCC30D5